MDAGSQEDQTGAPLAIAMNNAAAGIAAGERPDANTQHEDAVGMTEKLDGKEEARDDRMPESSDIGTAVVVDDVVAIARRARLRQHHSAAVLCEAAERGDRETLRQYVRPRVGAMARGRDTDNGGCLLLLQNYWG